MNPATPALMRLASVSSARAGTGLGACLARAFAAVLLVILLALATPAWSQATVGPPLGANRADLSELENQARSTSDDSRLQGIEDQAVAIHKQALIVMAAGDSELASAERRLAGATPHGRHRPTAAETARRRGLQAEVDGLALRDRQARAAAAAAGDTVNAIAQRRREGFSKRLFERSASPISPPFWTALAGAIGDDWQRLVATTDEAWLLSVRAPEPRGVLGLAAGLTMALLIGVPVRRRLERLGRRKSGEAVHPGLARSAAALWVALVAAGTPILAASVLRLGAQWGGVLSDDADVMAEAGVIAVGWAAAILALGRVLATDSDPRQRLLNPTEEAAGRLRIALMAVAAVTGVGFLLARLNFVIGASVAATIAANCVLSTAYAVVAGLTLLSLGGPDDDDRTAGPSIRASAWTLVSLVFWAAIVVTLVAVVTGYTALAAVTSSQIFWLSMIAAVTYLLLRAIDDLFIALFSDDSRAVATLASALNLRSPAIRQAALLVSAALQLIVLIAAICLAVTPFGQSGDRLLNGFSRFGGAIRLGSATVSPGAIAAGLGTLLLGVGLVHFVQRWTVRRYLPLTDWDAGLRNSVSTGVGYLGVAVALVCALAAMGLGFRQIALVASALSVGIGFGLQQIVQNFVSGVILLVERPVKVGDWVNVDGVEGDIRRIRVRATEIQTFDQSTAIIPNSDLITKMVQNKTLGGPRGRIDLQLSIASPADATRARQAILDTAAANPEILHDKPPAVYIDSLAGGGGVNFKCYLYVASPRDSYRVRSEVYFAILSAFQADHIPFAGVATPQNMVVEPGPKFQALLVAASSSAAPEAESERGALDAGLAAPSPPLKGRSTPPGETTP
jgi:potassium efflux system protein